MTIWVSKKWNLWAEFDQKSIKNMENCYLQYNSETNARANCQKESDVRMSRIWKSAPGMFAMGLGIDWPILRDIIRCLAFPVKPRHTHIAKKFDFYPQNGGKKENLPFTLKILKPPLSCCPLLLAGPNWTPPTWMWVLVMIRPWGHSWGVIMGVKRPKMGVPEETHENG